MSLCRFRIDVIQRHCVVKIYTLFVSCPNCRVEYVHVGLIVHRVDMNCDVAQYLIDMIGNCYFEHVEAGKVRIGSVGELGKGLLDVVYAIGVTCSQNNLIEHIKVYITLVF